MTALGRRTLRSGKEFSSFDLAVGPPVSPPQFFSVADCLKQRLEAQKITQILDEDVEIMPPCSLSLPPPSVPSPLPLPLTTTPPLPRMTSSRDLPANSSQSSSAPTNALDRKKKGSKRRKKEKREREAAESSDPTLKTIHQTHREAAEENVVNVGVNAAELPHTKRGWIGKILAQDGSEAPAVGPSTPPPGLGQHSYSQEEIDHLTGTEGFDYIVWLGEKTVPITDSHRHLFALLGGMPKDLVAWKVVTDGAAKMMADRAPHAHFTDEDWNHRRAHPDTPYPSISRGVSLGGGQLQPGELSNHPDNVTITDEMIAHEYFRRIVGFTNCKIVYSVPKPAHLS
ncbi:hypothetical protein MSAN_02027600 [Mycena sanguinolenta]|uniref:Uncharacterized protein n=1 Tax=Mycena sanguinolenta TaxID=230812 RepID=A0A8H6XLL5_9AGAR|nr:hypothetical protein MSAN_02027600 [Mycena sanguinolenta]